MLKLIAGILLFICGIALGVYVGIWWALIGGIVLVVESITADPVSASGIAYGVVRVMFAGFLGYVTAILAVLPSLPLIGKGIDELYFPPRSPR
jgi:hypothetical protein